MLLWGSGKKLEILKDPHLGAFAVIYTFAYMLFYAGASCEFAARAEGSARLLPVLFMTMERALSGLSVLSFPSAKKTAWQPLLHRLQRRKQTVWE